jgi:hypothetical protein
MVTLACTPTSGTHFFRDGQRVRIRTVPKTPSTKIQAFYDKNRVTVSPDNGVTNTDGYLDVEVRCGVGQSSIESIDTTIIFDADQADSEPAKYQVTCQKAE